MKNSVPKSSDFEKIAKTYPMLVREILDNLELKDMGRLKCVSKWFDSFITKEYDITVVGKLYKEHIWQDIRKFEKTKPLTHKNIRIWNPEWGKAYVYSFIYSRIYSKMKYNNIVKNLKIM
jgi:hypothetical protein